MLARLTDAEALLRDLVHALGRHEGDAGCSKFDDGSKIDSTALANARAYLYPRLCTPRADPRDAVFKLGERVRVKAGARPCASHFGEITGWTNNGWTVRLDRTNPTSETILAYGEHEIEPVEPSKPAGERPRLVKVTRALRGINTVRVGAVYEVESWPHDGDALIRDDAGQPMILVPGEWEPAPSPREVEIPEEVDGAIRGLRPTEGLRKGSYYIEQAGIDALRASIRTALAAASHEAKSVLQAALARKAPTNGEADGYVLHVSAELLARIEALAS